MLIGGIILIVVAGIALLVARSQRGKLGALAATETVPCSAVVADHPCEVVGEAQAGPGGELSGPASGKPCVWYRHKVTRHWEEWDRDSDGDRRRVDRSRVLSDDTSSEAFAVRDETGQVLVDPHGAKVDAPVGSFHERKDAHSMPQGLLGGVLEMLDSRDEEVEVEEWIIPTGRRLYVRGRAQQATAGLTMGDPGDKHFLISTRSESELAASAGTWTKAATAVAGVAGVAGAVLVVAGALA